MGHGGGKKASEADGHAPKTCSCEFLLQSSLPEVMRLGLATPKPQLGLLKTPILSHGLNSGRRCLLGVRRKRRNRPSWCRAWSIAHRVWPCRQQVELLQLPNSHATSCLCEAFGIISPKAQVTRRSMKADEHKGKAVDISLRIRKKNQKPDHNAPACLSIGNPSSNRLTQTT